jgi:hypothetical protein
MDPLVDPLENTLWDIYRYLLSTGASAETARITLLSIARDKLPGADGGALRETTSRVIEQFHKVRSLSKPSPERA